MCNSMKHVSTPVERRALAVSDGAFLLGAACLMGALVACGVHDYGAMQWALAAFAASGALVVACGAVAASEGGWPGRLALIAAFGGWIVICFLVDLPRRLIRAVSK